MTDSPAGEETLLQRTIAWTSNVGLPILRWLDGAGEHVAKIEKRTTIGSAHGNGLVIADPSVSRIHSEFDLREDGLWVRDLGSRNGTHVNGVCVEAARVPDGGRIRLGSTEITANYATVPRTVQLWPENRFGPLVGESAAMRELFASLARIAPLESSVLIRGETGTGKELVARAIHDASPRAANPFVVVDCAALPDTLLDSELFGHTKGAFTGATNMRTGAIESADGGTVFLDEVGELPVSMQPKLLRMLESRTVRRIGETNYRKVNVRIVAATHRDLLTMVNAGEFREDLYFRLAVLPVVVPPLRERPEDIEHLIRHFTAGAGAIDPELMKELVSRRWRGNVRELRNFVERAVALGPVRALAMASEDAAAPRTGGGEETPGGGNFGISYRQGLKEFREQWMDAGEREYLRQLLTRHERNVQAAAEEAGVVRTYIYRLIRKHDL